MYEICIYLAIHLGVKKINVLGWDLGSPKTDKISRFYESKNSISDKFKMVFYKSSPLFYNYVVRIIENKVNLLKYRLGFKAIVLHKPRITKNEANFIAESTKAFYEWLQSKNIELFIFSSISMVDTIIPRKKL